MRIYKSKWFDKWAEKEGLPDESLRLAIHEIENGLVEADLGSHLLKKRVAIPGQGKRGSLRTILAFKVKNNAFFIFGFAKSQKDNISDKELKTLKRMSKELLNYSASKLDDALSAGNLVEVISNDE